MIIVNQDRNMIVNFDNVENIDIVADLDGTGEIPFKIYFETYSSREELGKYKTEERAKEVLQEIVKEYENVKAIFDCETGKLKNFINRPKIYKMPEK